MSAATAAVPWIVPGLASLVPAPDYDAELAAELASARLSIEKQAAIIERYDAQLSELEQLAGRPVELIIESYRRAAGLYRP